MNPPLPNRQIPRAFTLIELLVVISIIAILASILLPVAGKVMDSARKVQAKNTMLSIITAVKSFQTDYGVYPVTSGESSNGTADAIYGDTNAPNQAVNLMDTLRADGQGNDAANSGSQLNTRRIPYLDIPPAKSTTSPKNGIGATDRQPYDPWGNVYWIMIDSNYDNVLTNPYAANAGPTTLGMSVIAWSLGFDKQGGQNSADKNQGTAKDDVISWQ